MIKYTALLLIIFLLIACRDFSPHNSFKVSNPAELKESITKATPGDEIILSNGVWKDISVYFKANGTKDNPIILRAETAGKVLIEGNSFLKISGRYLIIDGLYFRNGHTPSNAVIEFRIDENNIANYCIVQNCVIENYVQPNRYDADHWIEFWGRHNQLTYCYITGKFNQGPTIRVNLNGNQHIKNYHQITNNHFGPRPRKGGPKAETIQIGDSYTSMAPSYVNVSHNFFERCNGEVEIISSKSNFNEFKHNIFYKCEGSLVFRHGNYCLADGNIFIGDKKSLFNGGIRVINTGHWITNNYFLMLKGDEFRSSLAIMNGIPKSPLNRYNQVTDVVVAYNTWIDCQSPWQFSVGANVNKKDVLPESEIRSARPQRIILANNVIFNHEADISPIKAYDKVDGITFKNNIINNQDSDFKEYIGLKAENFHMKKVDKWIFIPDSEDKVLSTVYTGFGFENIQKDMFGNSRTESNRIGAAIAYNQNYKINENDYGARWYSKEILNTSETIIIAGDEEEIFEKTSQANDGDIIELGASLYNLDRSLVINKKITLKSKDPKNKVRLNFRSVLNSAAFELNPKGHLILENVILQGNGEQHAFATLEKNMSFPYNLSVDNSQISGFKNILKTHKGSFADTISFSNTIINNSINGIDLAAETDDLGDYNAEFVFINNCTFENIKSNVINFYRGGYDESTIGGNLVVYNSRFKNCGSQEQSKILIKTRGIINVDISKNSFKDNPIKLVALLWGEKNNHYKDNSLENSGIFRTDLYLKQKLVY